MGIASLNPSYEPRKTRTTQFVTLITFGHFNWVNSVTNTAIRRQKDRERFLLERFFDASAIETTIIDACETPDFIVRVGDQCIGIEVTEFFISHESGGKTMQAQESISTRIISLAQKIYEESDAPPTHVSICFGAGDDDLRTLNRDHTAKALASFVRKLSLPPWNLVNWRPSEVNELPPEVSFVHALGVPSFDMAHWNVAGAGWVTPLTIQPLQARIDEKARRLHQYQRNATEIWLVVIADATNPSQLVEVKPSFDPTAISSPFARTYFYRYPDKNIVRLAESR